MSSDIAEISVVDERGVCLFCRGDRYLVPIYQRAFAWGTGDGVRPNEILQLMDDAMTFRDGRYRLGSLVVARQGENLYEVIDGQQRLTALFLILSRLNVEVAKEGLSYACRPTAEAILSSIAKGTFSLDDGVPATDPATGIVAGVRAIQQKIDAQPNPEAYKEALLARFRSVVLCRTIVPEKTDLNRYFEIMNTRGEQLEQQDIVKARLMRNLPSEIEKSAFATIWDACSDMDGYCQMHFHDTAQRANLFGDEWTELQDLGSGKVVLEICGKFSASDNSKEGHSFREMVLKVPNAVPKADDPGQYSRFESIIDFRHFLLHALRSFSGCGKVDVSLDDGRMIQSFADALAGYQGTKEDFSREFIWHLLRCRYMFDRYVIKRGVDADGTSGWSLEELVANEDGGASYRNTRFADRADRVSDNDDILMLEACLRVSYLDLKRMYWISDLLTYLSMSKIDDVQGKDILNRMQAGVKEEIRSFLGRPDHANLGVATPHIVLHYLDYVLWQGQEEIGKSIEQADFAKGFSFEYRSSVEHWYPQNPPNNVPWPDRDHFGNLCILRSDINSKFSNLLPESKQQNHEQYLRLEHQSLKLRIMAELTKKYGWSHEVCSRHEGEMLKLLRDDVEIIHD